MTNYADSAKELFDNATIASHKDKFARDFVVMVAEMVYIAETGKFKTKF